MLVEEAQEGPDPVVGDDAVIVGEQQELAGGCADAQVACPRHAPPAIVHQADRGRPTISLPDPNALGMQGSLRLVSPITGFTFRADSDLVPVRFTIDSVRPAVSSTNRVA